MRDAGGKKDDELAINPFADVSKGAVLQEARVFNERELNARKCRHVLTKVLYLLGQGETLNEKEATEIFFSVTKLFANKDVYLRRMVYLLIKELADSADQVIIVTNCLTQDMNSKTEMFRSNSIRVLCRITDSQMLAQIERYLKQAIVDNSPAIASAALVSGTHLLNNGDPGCEAVLKRWINEVQTQLMANSHMVQFHALCLNLQLKASDRLAVSKTVQQLTKTGAVRSPLAACVMVRKVTQQLAQEERPAAHPYFEFLERCLRDKSEMVVYEAARSICSLRRASPEDLSHSITVLQMFLSSSKPTLRFAAVRTLNVVAITHPLSVTACNIDLETLISDPNRSIATLAITTLLKTGSETSVDRLMKQIGSFMSEIADEFKIVVVDAIRSICIKYKDKHRLMMNFLSSILREEGGYDFKKAIVDSILTLINNIPEVTETGLGHLCEFIEDCEYSQLSTAILHLLGERGPETSHPAKYLRFIFNRVVLENATVRASAVCALGKFGLALEDLRPTCSVLLQRCLFDQDDEVRDRASFYLAAMGGADEAALTTARGLVVGGLPCPISNLEGALQQYLGGDKLEPFDMSSVSRALKKGEVQDRSVIAAVEEEVLGAAETAAPAHVSASSYAKALMAVPEIAALGKLFSSSPRLKLTEDETEYAVTCVTHMFEEAIVFQYDVTNTLEDQLIEDIRMEMVCDDEELELELGQTIPAEASAYDQTAQTYSIFVREAGSVSTADFECVLKFKARDVDPTTGEADEGGFEDEYPVDAVEISTKNYIKPSSPPNFRGVWETTGADGELQEQFELDAFKSIPDGVAGVVDFLGMSPCEGTQKVPDSVKSHTVLLAGVFIGGIKVLARANVALSGAGILLSLQVRAEDPDVAAIVVASVG